MLDNYKKRSDKQQAASRANGAQGHGPVNARGKKHSSANALKHGLFASELFVPEPQRPEFEQLREELAAQLEPNTPLLWIFFDDIVSLAWRKKMALRLEQLEVKRQLAAADEPQADGAGTTIPGHHNQRQQIAFLDSLEQRVRMGEPIDEKLKEEGREKLGEEFMAELIQWKPVPGAQIRYGLVEMSAAKCEKYHIPQPGDNLPNEQRQQLKAKEQELAEKLQSENNAREMTRKLIEITRQLILAHSSSGSTQSQSNYYEIAVRTQESLSRTWLRMLQEYQKLKYAESKA